ncbi:MAG: acetolactate synthase small subunit [Ruminococcaceae bacterium]|nr:acetolactate synthase small subunit [Oscillospiraceae bacterium]
MEKMQILSVLVENTAGVLSQVSRMFSRKGFNIDSLAVGPTDDPAISRITIMIEVDDLMIQQIANQLNKLLPVISVKILEQETSVCRELILVKVKVEDRNQRDEIIQLANIFRVSIVDVAMKSLTICITGDHSKSHALLGLLSEFGILELVRTGAVALERGSGTIHCGNN